MRAWLFVTTLALLGATFVPTLITACNGGGNGNGVDAPSNLSDAPLGTDAPPGTDANLSDAPSNADAHPACSPSGQAQGAPQVFAQAWQPASVCPNTIAVLQADDGGATGTVCLSLPFDSFSGAVMSTGSQVYLTIPFNLAAGSGAGTLANVTGNVATPSITITNTAKPTVTNLTASANAQAIITGTGLTGASAIAASTGTFPQQMSATTLDQQNSNATTLVVTVNGYQAGSMVDLYITVPGCGYVFAGTITLQ